MAGYSLQSSLEEQARKKTTTLDGIRATKRAPLVSHTLLVTPSRRAVVLPLLRKPEALYAERQSFLYLLQEFSWSEQGTRLWRKTELSVWRLRRLVAILLPQLAPHKMLYASIAGGIAFGMVSMAFIEHSFGPGVFARSEASSVVVNTNPAFERTDAVVPLGGSYDAGQDVFFEYFGQVTKEKYEESIRDMVSGYPIESMLPYIFSQDRLTAAFLVGIAKKESNWGKRIPVLDGQDCFNYWGYRGVRRMMGSGGHTCFNSEKDAVETVAKRLNTLINSEQLNTPEKMIIWKCGFSCQGHSRESVKKWISDVDMYFSRLNDE